MPGTTEANAVVATTRGSVVNVLTNSGNAAR